MSSKLSRAAQWMLVQVFKDREPITIDKYGVTISGVTFLLNDRAIEMLNQQANDTRGQFPQLGWEEQRDDINYSGGNES